MSTELIVSLLLVFLVVVVAVVWNLKRKQSETLSSLKQSETETEKKNLLRKIAVLQAEKDGLTRKLSEQESRNEHISQRLAATDKESAEKNNALKQKYEKLLAEAKEQCTRLDQELANALKGKLDATVQEKLSEAERLKKKIQDLEEELEESEEDNEDLKKKISARNAELEELQDALCKEQKAAKQLHNELNEVRQELDDQALVLEQKMESLSFIQEILSASEVRQSDQKALNKDIDHLESFVKGQLTDVYSFIYSTYEDLSWGDLKGTEAFNYKKKFFYDWFDQWASTKRKSWLDNKTTVAFVGEFSAGKTSIVNRILSQDDPSVPKLPVSTKATTAIPTYIAGGQDIHYNFISGDGKRKSIGEDTFRKVSKEMLDQVKGVSSLIKYFVMTYRNPYLNGLSVLDTPGFNSNDQEDRERTIDTINECDALFWVFDVNAGTVNRSSIAVIKERLNKPLYVVINKVDTKPKSEVDKVERLISQTLANEGLTIQQFIRFSSKTPLEHIMKPIRSVKKIEERNKFLTELNDDLEGLLNIFEDAVEESSQRYNEAVQTGDNLTYNFNTCLRYMQDDCVTAYHIPQWVEHIFSSDRFEMTANEGKRLQNILETIANQRIQELSKKFEERVDKAMDIQNEWTFLCNLKAAWQKLEECHEQFNKINANIQQHER